MESTFSLWCVDIERLHHDRQFDAAVGSRQYSTRPFTRDAGDHHHDPLGAVSEFDVRRAHIDHQVAVAFANANHGAGCEHVADHLGRGSGFHACRTGQRLWPHDRQDQKIGHGAHVSRRLAAGDEGGTRAMRPRARERTAHERRSARRRDADDNVTGRDVMRIDDARRLGRIIFGALNWCAQCTVAARDDAHDHRGVGTERWWTLAGIEHAEPSRRTGADVEQSMIAAKCRFNFFDDGRDPVSLCRDGVGDHAIFRIQQIDNPLSSREIDVDGARIAMFGDARIERRSGHVWCGRLTRRWHGPKWHAACGAAKLGMMNHEPQDSMTRGACHRVSARSVTIIALVCVCTTATAPALGAQLRGRTVGQRGAGVWVSAGGGSLAVTSINDGATQSRWLFSTDPLWQLRGTIEKGIDAVTTIGVAASVGRADLIVERLAPTPPGTALVATTPVPSTCRVSCAARADLWSLMGQFRSGGGGGFHTTFEAAGGVLGVRNMRTRDSASVAIGKPTGTVDLTGVLGLGFALPLSRHFVLTLVQDFGLVVHSKTNLPDGSSRYARTRTTRAAIRIGLGN